MRKLLIGITVILVSCSSEEMNNEKEMSSDEVHPQKKNVEVDSKNRKILEYFATNKGNDAPSQSLGGTGNGSLINGKLFPFYGNNFEYFSELSYLAGRAFVNHRVRDLMLEAYDSLALLYPTRKFYIMECSHKTGGKFYPHLTHQNGLSVDFMALSLCENKPCSRVDQMGIPHYWLEFNDQGQLETDTTVNIDFDIMAHHLIIMHRLAGKHQLRISKVLVKTNLHRHLFGSSHGQILKQKKLPLATYLKPIINAQHDDHYHVDFAVIN